MWRIWRRRRWWLDRISQACESHRKGIANREGDSTKSHKHVNLYMKGFGGEGARVLTNAALRPGMPPCPSLWVVFGTCFTRVAALRNFNGGSPTSSTTDWHLATFSSSAFRSRSDLPNFLAFLALVSCSVTSFSCLATFSCLAAFSYTSNW
jgi:hypothetical protein